MKENDKNMKKISEFCEFDVSCNGPSQSLGLSFCCYKIVHDVIVKVHLNSGIEPNILVIVDLPVLLDLFD